MKYSSMDKDVHCQVGFFLNSNKKYIVVFTVEGPVGEGNRQASSPPQWAVRACTRSRTGSPLILPLRPEYTHSRPPLPAERPPRAVEVSGPTVQIFVVVVVCLVFTS